MNAVLGDEQTRLLPAALRAADAPAFFLTVRMPKQHPSAKISPFSSYHRTLPVTRHGPVTNVRTLPSVNVATTS